MFVNVGTQLVNPGVQLVRPGGASRYGENCDWASTISTATGNTKVTTIIDIFIPESERPDTRTSVQEPPEKTIRLELLSSRDNGANGKKCRQCWPTQSKPRPSERMANSTLSPTPMRRGGDTESCLFYFAAFAGSLSVSRLPPSIYNPMDLAALRRKR
jgi:hypothetical protein